ncbi:tautomerase family protein [Flavobacterium hauense]
MPVINLKVSGPENPILAGELAKAISNLTNEFLKKRPEVTVVNVSFTPNHLWFVNSQSLAELGMNSFYLDIKISQSTNLKDDKAAYIAHIHSTLDSIVGNIHPVSYTVVNEIPADAYGYEGLTIEYKYISNKK